MTALKRMPAWEVETTVQMRLRIRVRAHCAEAAIEKAKELPLRRFRAYDVKTGSWGATNVPPYPKEGEAG